MVKNSAIKIYVFEAKHFGDNVEIKSSTEEGAKMVFAKMGYNLKYWDIKIKENDSKQGDVSTNE